MTRSTDHLSISELAARLALPRYVIRDAIDNGRIPSLKLGPKDALGRQKRYVSLAVLRDVCRDLYDALMLKMGTLK